MKSNAEWIYWGETDPLYAVAAVDGKSRDGEDPWTSDAFLELGRRDVADVMRHWTHYGVDTTGRCAEIGCGAGRMTSALLGNFAAVSGVDVSEGQIQKAREHLATAGDRVRFHLVSGAEIPEADGSCSGVFTCHVLQHLPGIEAVGAYFREAYRVLGAGGSVCAHLPSPGAHRGSITRPLWWYDLRVVRMRMLRALGRRRIMDYHIYRADRILRLLEDVGFSDVELRIIPMTSNGDPHSYFFGRKS